MENFICITCGTQFAETEQPPAGCPICEDPRQYVGREGQKWTTLEQLRADHHNHCAEEGAEVMGIGTEPSFAIGQRALLVQSPGGNVLWDCVSLLDADTITRVQTLGGLRAIAISHPHYYSSMVEWSSAFGGIPIYLHAADREWVMHSSPNIQFWEGVTKPLWDGLTLINCGGHFDGGAVLHWPGADGGKGALLTGDVIQVVADTRYVSFMWSYPNLIPLPAREIRQIQERVARFEFEKIYGAWWGRNVPVRAKHALEISCERYLGAIADAVHLG